jgi:hypothetical protein
MWKTNSMRVISILSSLILLALAGMATAQGIEKNTDRPGKDYKVFYLYGTDEAINVSDCRSACTKDPKCSAWTYVKPGYQGTKGRCYLKSEVPKPVSKKCCYSGYVCHDLVFATTSPLPSAVIGGDYKCQIKMSSGVPPYKFYPMQVPSDGRPPRIDTSRDQRFSMPLGLKLTRSGLILGQVKSGAAGYRPILIQVRDSCPSCATCSSVISKKFYINIKQQP